MMDVNRYRDRLALWTAILVLMAWYLYFFGHVILAPNSVMHSAYEDGLKNYYTFAYQTGNTGASLHFSGMNYPFGEHVVFTDGIPLLGFIVGLFPFVKGYEVGILNIFLYLSIFLAAGLIWKIFTRLKVSPWAAAAGVVGIIVLSPQFFRLGSHYGLSLMWIIPLIILQLIKQIESEKMVKNSIVIALTIFLLFFIHPYMGLMSLVFSLSVLLIVILSRKKKRTEALFSILIVGTSAVLFRLFLLLTDLHPERTEKPQGLFEHFALPETIFVPFFSPFKKILEFFIPVREGQPFEGWGYIGLSVMLTLLAAAAFWVYKFLRRRAGRYPGFNSTLIILLPAAFLVLLFSMLIPIKWLPEDLIYKLKVFNQFRSVGRFSWVFYYTAGISAVYILDRLYQHSKGKIKLGGVICLAAFPLLNLSEAWEGTDFFSKQIGRSTNLFSEKGLEKYPEWKKVIQLIEIEKDAVLLPLPFFHVGAEQFMRKGTPEIQQIAMVISYHAARPTMASFLSRTSEPETRTLFGLIAPELNPDISLDFHGLNSVLILTNGEQLDPNEQILLDNAKKIYQGKTIGLYKLDLKNYGSGQRVKRINTADQLNANGLNLGKALCSDTSFLIIDDYDSLKTSNAFSGNGSLELRNADYLFLQTIYSVGDMELEASFWFKKGEPGSFNPMFVVEEIDTVTNSGQWTYMTDPKRSPVILKEWAFVQLPIKMRKGPYKYNVLIVGNSEKGDQWFTVDELMIRNLETNILTPTAAKWGTSRKSLNNVPLGSLK